MAKKGKMKIFYYNIACCTKYWKLAYHESTDRCWVECEKCGREIPIKIIDTKILDRRLF
jgi:hypothetical protein